MTKRGKRPIVLNLYLRVVAILGVVVALRLFSDINQTTFNLSASIARSNKTSTAQFAQLAMIKHEQKSIHSILDTLISYDTQLGSYIEKLQANLNYLEKENLTNLEDYISHLY